ncbi:hypothetical protein [Paraburkholderia rhizosphaerae]|uniref:Uncharacterized protein n=1 Tax=Paraburkholderia rhizosphaerae TaxID=480658 RepID=A0A4R8LSC5_9BURK|nr:hypothetical protein [Paraburkholderia rhizosphaerae]TDY48314.1 hypothetical protein BX592_111249 [Paraburkholderia rhizosphaerae]
MPDVLDLPIARGAAPFDPIGKTVSEVVRQIEEALRHTEIEPEWVGIANTIGDDDESLYGLRPSAQWPECERTRERLAISVARGRCEGWIVQVDHVCYRVAAPTGAGSWQSTPLLRIKSLSRSQAWSVAAVISRMLDVD